MERIVNIIGIMTLGILSWQDFRSRQIAWWLLVILVVVFFFTALFGGRSISEIGKAFSLNIIFLCVQFLFVWIWFSIRNKKPAKIIDVQIGLGDVLFMICIALFFSTVNFMLFYTLGMILTLFVVLIIKLFNTNNKREIPLAGALSIPLILLCTWKIFDPSRDFYSDEWLIQLLGNNP
jgi:Flp pilus assembly protein protease CpaA